MSITVEDLIKRAIEVRSRAYAKYSNFPVGAALLTSDNEIFTGCNVENISFGLTMCAERVAIGNAIQAGKIAFSRIAIAADSKQPVIPCGACRQVMAEFNPELLISMTNLEGVTEEHSLATLLPKSSQGILG